MENAKITLGVAERLIQGGGVSQAELYQARSAYQGAQAVFETAVKAYDDTKLKSPVSGVLAWSGDDLEAGNYISSGQNVFRVVDLSGLKIELSVGERQISLITPGLEADIHIPAAPGSKTLKGKVKAAAAAGDLSTGSYKVIVEADVPEGSGIRAGMSASVSIHTEDPRRGILLPLSAVVFREGKDYVFMDEEGKAVPLEIEAGEI